jgi:hypothetical protein
MHRLNVTLWYNRRIGTDLVNYRLDIWYTFVLVWHLQPWPRTMTKQDVFSACMTSQMTCIQYYVKTKHITPHPFILMIKCICVRGWGLKFVGAVTYWVLVQVKCILQPALSPLRPYFWHSAICPLNNAAGLLDVISMTLCMATRFSRCLDITEVAYREI